MLRRGDLVKSKMKVSVFIATSLDGFIARANGSIDWLESFSRGSSSDYGYARFMTSVDVLVMGRKTFANVMSFEPLPFGGKAVIVLTRQRGSMPRRLPARVEVMSGSPGRIVKALSRRGFRHVYVDGGNTIQGFLKAGLIDEMTISVIPILLGSGIPLFGRAPRQIALRHDSTHRFASGLVQSKYAMVTKVGRPK